MYNVYYVYIYMHVCTYNNKNTHRNMMSLFEGHFPSSMSRPKAKDSATGLQLAWGEDDSVTDCSGTMVLTAPYSYGNGYEC